MHTIAALIACFNRKDKTIKCLTSLYSILPDCDVYLLDDGSTDGTSETVRKEYPRVKIIEGDGSLFWSRGMHRAWSEAVKLDYDYYLWLNDDVELYPFFFEELLECSNIGGDRIVVSGLIEDKEKTKILYGGSDSERKLIQPASSPQQIKYMNGNVVLVPKKIVQAIGILDPMYHHDLGDVDYGLSAQKAGFRVLSTRRAIAFGYSNNYCRVRLWNATLKERLKKLHSPLGSPPAINYYYRKKHFGIVNASVYWLYLYVLNILPDKIVSLIWGDTYKNK